MESDSGFMGGAQAHEYMAPSAAGEDRVALCGACGYAANVELARSVASAAPAAAGRRAAAGAARTTAGRGSGHARAADHRRGLGVSGRSSRRQLIKSLVYMAGDKPVMALVRGDHDLHENKLARYLKAEVRPAHPEEVLEATGRGSRVRGSGGLAERGLRIIADETLRPDGPGGPREYAAGANKPHTHLRGVVPGRDFQAEYADLREAEEGDACPECGQPLAIEQVIEVGNIFKLGTKYSKPLGATVLDESGQERPIVMGSYGIGPARIAAAAVEQSNDERASSGPRPSLPSTSTWFRCSRKIAVQTEVAESLYEGLTAEGWDVLWDDRDERPGVKFADAELIGCPVRVTVGKKAADGIVEVEPRAGGSREDVPVAECAAQVRRLWEAAP